MLSVVVIVIPVIWTKITPAIPAMKIGRIFFATLAAVITNVGKLSYCHRPLLLLRSCLRGLRRLHLKVSRHIERFFRRSVMQGKRSSSLHVEPSMLGAAPNLIAEDH